MSLVTRVKCSRRGECASSQGEKRRKAKQRTWTMNMASCENVWCIVLLMILKAFQPAFVLELGTPADTHVLLTAIHVLLFPHSWRSTGKLRLPLSCNCILDPSDLFSEYVRMAQATWYSWLSDSCPSLYWRNHMTGIFWDFCIFFPRTTIIVCVASSFDVSTTSHYWYS